MEVLLSQAEAAEAEVVLLNRLQDSMKVSFFRLAVIAGFLFFTSCDEPDRESDNSRISGRNYSDQDGSGMVPKAVQINQRPILDPLGASLNEIKEKECSDVIRFLANAGRLYPPSDEVRGGVYSDLEKEDFLSTTLALGQIREEMMSRTDYQGWETISCIDKLVSIGLSRKLIQGVLSPAEAKAIAEMVYGGYPTKFEIARMIGMEVEEDIGFEDIFIFSAQKIGDPQGESFSYLEGITKLKHDAAHFTSSENPVWLMWTLGQAQTMRAGLEYLVVYGKNGGDYDDLEGISQQDYNEIIGDFEVVGKNLEAAKALGWAPTGTGLSSVLSLLD